MSDQEEMGYALTYHPKYIKDRNLLWTNHEHRTLKEIRLNGIIETCTGRVEECRCGAWRLHGEDGSELQPWQPGWREPSEPDEQECRRATDGITPDAQGYTTMLALALYHGGARMKNESSPEDLRKDLMGAMNEMAQETAGEQILSDKVMIRQGYRFTRHAAAYGRE